MSSFLCRSTKDSLLPRTTLIRTQFQQTAFSRALDGGVIL